MEMPFAKQQEKLKQDIKDAFNFDRETEGGFLEGTTKDGGGC